MDLFSTTPHPNLLPFDGEVYYYPNFLNLKEATQFLNLFLETIAWENDRIHMYGKTIVTDRKVALYGDSSFVYGYSNNHRKALPWTSDLLHLKQLVEKKCNHQFNACLLNLYHHGDEGLGWHQDNEKELGQQPVIASLSLGADRKFDFKHISTKQVVSQILTKGSLLIMKGETQTHWLHKLPPTKLVKSPRINLTFRTVLP